MPRRRIFWRCSRASFRERKRSSFCSRAKTRLAARLRFFLFPYSPRPERFCPRTELPNDGMPLSLVGDLFAAASAAEKRGGFAATREHLSAALALDPAMAAPVHAQLARMLWLEGHWPAALAAAGRALAADSKNFLALIVRSRALSALARMSEACEANRRALQIQPHPEFHSQHGRSQICHRAFRDSFRRKLLALILIHGIRRVGARTRRFAKLHPCGLRRRP